MQCIVGTCLKPCLGYMFLISDTCQSDTLYLRDQGCEDPWLLFETKRGSASEKVWATLV